MIDIIYDYNAIYQWHTSKCTFLLNVYGNPILDKNCIYLHGAEKIKKFIVKHLTFKAAFYGCLPQNCCWLAEYGCQKPMTSMTKTFQDGDGGRCYQESYAKAH